MIFVERIGEVPTSLSSAETTRQAEDAIEHYKTWKAGDRGFGRFTRYREYDVQVALRRLFRGKCAYCEKKLEKGFFEVEHYRPKASDIGSAHPGYWWLALKWNNLLPTCPGCNKGLKQHIVTADMTVAEVEALQATEPKALAGKATQFPVGAARLVASDDDHEAEQPHIIDPTRSDPKPELRWRHDAAFSVLEAAEQPGGISILGAETIRCLALNRIDLVQGRTAVLTFLRAHRERIMADLENGAAEDGDPALLGLHLRYAMRRVDDIKLHAEPDQPFSAMAQSFVDAFVDELRDWAAAKVTAIA
jgi:uncharacterized protein (TIGR02646 family)